MTDLSGRIPPDGGFDAEPSARVKYQLASLWYLAKAISGYAEDLIEEVEEGPLNDDSAQEILNHLNSLVQFEAIKFLEQFTD